MSFEESFTVRKHKIAFSVLIFCEDSEARKQNTANCAHCLTLSCFYAQLERIVLSHRFFYVVHFSYNICSLINSPFPLIHFRLFSVLLYHLTSNFVFCLSWRGLLCICFESLSFNIMRKKGNFEEHSEVLFRTFDLDIFYVCAGRFFSPNRCSEIFLIG